MYDPNLTFILARNANPQGLSEVLSHTISNCVNFGREKLQRPRQRAISIEDSDKISVFLREIYYHGRIQMSLILPQHLHKSQHQSFKFEALLKHTIHFVTHFASTK